MKINVQNRSLREEAGEVATDGGGAVAEQDQEAPVSAGSLGFYTEAGLDRSKLDSLPEEAKSFRSMLEKYPTENDLFTGLKNLQYSASQKRLERPPEDAPDDIKAQHQQMVREYNRVPESPEGYGLNRPDDIPEELWNDDRAAGIADIMHRHNIPPEAVKELMDAEVEFTKSIMAGGEEAKIAQKSETIASLRAEFGNGTDQMLLDAKTGAATLGLNVPDDILDTTIDGKTFIQAMAKMTKLVSEDRLTTPISNMNSGPETYNDLLSEVKSIKGDPANPLNSDFNSGDPVRMERAQKQLKTIYSRMEALKR